MAYGGDDLTPFCLLDQWLDPIDKDLARPDINACVFVGGQFTGRIIPRPLQSQ
jgi:hypothetical protein